MEKLSFMGLSINGGSEGLGESWKMIGGDP